jgi:predicted deacylase
MDGSIQSEQVVKIGLNAIRPNEVLHFDYEVAEVAGIPLRIPISVINGARGGPTLCVTSGLHGCEYDSIEAAVRLSNTFLPSEIAGRLIVLPIINIQKQKKRCITFVSDFVRHPRCLNF